MPTSLHTSTPMSAPNQTLPPAESRRVRIPADVDRPDRILAGLTAHQLAILTVAGLLLWAGWAATRTLVSPVAFAAAAVPVALAGTGLAVGRRDGVSLDRYLLAGLRWRRDPRRLVPAPAGIPTAPAWLAARPATGYDPRPPAPLRLPVRGVRPDGTVDLGPDGVAALAEVSTVNFALRTPAEQDQMVAAFARTLNGLSGPVQILIRAVPVDLSALAHRLEQHAGALADPTLAAAAGEHAAFLTRLAADRDLLVRRTLLIAREASTDRAAAGRVRRRLDDAATALTAAGLLVSHCDGPTASGHLQDAADPAPARRRP